MYTKRILLIQLVFIFLLGLTALAQEKDKISDDRFFPEFRVDEDMKVIKAEREPLSISYGGWITPVVIDERNSTALTSSVTITKLWIQSTLWRNSFLYIRGKDVFFRVLNEEEIDVDDMDNVIDLDVGFIGMSNDKRTLNLFLGRKFFVLGTGLVFNGRGDGGEFVFYSRFVDIQLFGAYTGLMLKDNNPYGLSDKDITDGAKRIFAGGSIQKEFYNQAVYLLGLAQIDQQDEEEGEKIRYQSQYYGVGAKGTVSDLIAYYGEFIYQTGKSYYSGTGEEENIAAYAALLGLQYFPDVALNPMFILQYAYGSGENTEATTGDASDDDNGFRTFGTFVGGYALRPDLSNIHVFRVGCALSPFYDSSSRSLRRMNILLKYSYYMKDKPNATISRNNVPESTLDEKEIGHGGDIAFRWRIYYDLSFFISYGIFLPGKAYDSSAEARHFTMGGFNIIF
jgi:hypothetical protein